METVSRKGRRQRACVAAAGAVSVHPAGTDQSEAKCAPLRQPWSSLSS